MHYKVFKETKFRILRAEKLIKLKVFRVGRGAVEELI